MNTLYLVDDHAIVREGLRAVLQAAGHTVVGEAASLDVAWRELPQCRPEVLLLDLHLGAHAGWPLLEALPTLVPGIRALVLTMSAQPHDVVKALRLGAHGYLLKGSNRAALLAAIDAVARGERHLGPDVVALLTPESLADAACGAARASTEADALACLSAREYAVMLRVVRGATSAAIATELGLSPKTVDTYRSRLMTKVGVADLPALVLLALRTGLIDDSGDLTPSPSND